MSAATTCPGCNKALPASVVSGPAQAVVRCEGCQTLLLWSNGRVMRSAKSSTGTMMGMPAVKLPATKEAEAPLPELKPEADAVPVTAKSDFPKPPPAKTPPPRTATQPLARVTPQKASVTGIGDNVATKVGAPPPELRKESARKDPTPAPMKLPPSGAAKLPAGATPAKATPTVMGMPAVTVKPAGVTKPVAPTAPATVTKPVAPTAPATVTAKPATPGAAAKPAVPTATAAKPGAPAAAKPAVLAAAKPAVPATSGAKPEAGKGDAESPHVVAAVAEVPQMPSAGEMVDPSAWFAGDVSEVVPAQKMPVIDSKPLPAESTGIRPAPLPPPPAMGAIEEAEPFEIEPFGEEKTPAVPISMMDVPSGPIATNLPSQPIAVAPPRPPVREPSQKIATVPAREPSQKITTVPAREPSQKIATVPAREPSQKIATVPAAPSAPMTAKEPSQKFAMEAPGKKSAASIRGADPLVPATAAKAASTDLPNVGTAIGKMPEPPPGRATTMGRPVSEAPKAEPVSAAIDLLPPSPSSTPGKGAPKIEALTPERADATPVKAHVAINAPEAPLAHEPSAEALPPPPATPSPFPDTSMGLEATSQSPMPPVTSRVSLVAVPRRMLFIVGGAAAGVIVLVVLVMALSSHGGSKRTVATTKPAVTAPAVAIAPKPEAPKPTAPTTAPTPAPSPPPTAPTTAPTEAAATPTPAPTGETAAPPGGETPPKPVRRRGTLGGKKVVLEYDPKPTSPVPPSPSAPTPMGEDPSTVARAREAYHKGNVKLFAGDTQGAIALYRESLKIYPGYVAGYRGLGLAYESASNSDEALKAFHTYVRTVPSANDTPIIRRRIERLESAKPSAQ